MVIERSVTQEPFVPPTFRGPLDDREERSLTKPSALDPVFDLSFPKYSPPSQLQLCPASVFCGGLKFAGPRPRKRT